MWAQSYRRDFSGGENLRTQPEFLEPNQLLKAINVCLDANGHVITRLGKTTLLTNSLGSGKVISMHRYSKADGTQKLLVQHGTSLYAATWDGAAAISTMGAAIKTGLTVNSVLRSVVWKDKIYLTNGTENIFTYDGTTVADLAGSPPKSYTIKVYANRLWIVDAANPNQVRFSDLEGPTVWDALNVILVRDNDGDIITGLSPVAGGMVILKRNSVFPLYGTNKDNLRIGEPISRYVGCQGYSAYIDDGVFLGKDNLYRFDLSSVTPFPETHTEYIAGLTVTQKQSVQIAVHPIERRALMITGNADNDILVIDGKYNGAITRWQGLNVSCMVAADDKNDPGTLIFGDKTDGKLFTYKGDDDDSAAIVWTIKHGYTDEGIGKEKIWRTFEPEFEFASAGGYLISISADVDNEMTTETAAISGSFVTSTAGIWGTSVWGTGTWGASRTVLKPRFEFHTIRGDRVSFQTSAGQRTKYNGYKSKYREVGNI
jgi:hypothetical protein